MDCDLPASVDIPMEGTSKPLLPSDLSPVDRITNKPALTPSTQDSNESAVSVGSARTAVTADASTTQTHRSEESSTSYQSSGNQTFRMVLPSPSRGRLDVQYAKRLCLTGHGTMMTVSERQQRQLSPSSTSIPPAADLRDSSSLIFRPTPIFNQATSTKETAPFSFEASQPSTSRRARSARIDADWGASDRFIPSRATSNLNMNLWDALNDRSSPRTGNSTTQSNDTTSTDQHNGTSSNNPDDPADTNGNSTRSNDLNNPSPNNLHNVLLRSELLGENIGPYTGSNSQHMATNHWRSSGSGAPLRDGVNRLRFQSPRQAYLENVYNEAVGPASVVNSFSLTPVGSAASQRLMAAPQKRKRRIAKVPFKVLDAPALQDDFYLNLVDWSSQNVLAVGLGSCVYLWSACTSKVTKLCDLAQTEDAVTSVSWAQRGTHLAVGTNRGEVQLWDTIKCKKVRTMGGHSARVGTLAWSGPVLASGSRDRLIFLRDVRVQAAFTDRLGAHKQEVCGLRWSFDEPAFLASGGNDNQLHVVDSRNPSHPVHLFSDHTAAVKAIAWSPHQHGLLASGGGTADRCIRFWNTLSGSSLSCVDTGSQVCNLAWSQNCNEIVSTHGYSLNQIVVWRYPSMSKVVTLTGHTYRVLYLAMSPDGSTIVTGAGDETLRFWQVSVCIVRTIVGEFCFAQLKRVSRVIFLTTF